MFKDKSVLLGVCGGIAAFKAAALVSMLNKSGADVHVILTKNATKFITPITMEALSSNPVLTDMFNSFNSVPHIKAARDHDVIAIVPATANMIGKVANGIADDLLSTVLMATTKPVVYAPAMNISMYKNQFVQDNLLSLTDMDNVSFVGPDSGYLACGEEGEGRLAPIEEIRDAILYRCGDLSLEGVNVLITAGPTAEDLDPVRFLTNRSTGKMGYALAREAKKRGANVVLISGPVSINAPFDVNLQKVRSADEMYKAVMKYAPTADVIIKSAAVADFTPEFKSFKKIKKTGKKSFNPIFKPTKDILKELSTNRKRRQFMVGFAAETGQSHNNAIKKLKDKKLDMIVFNDVSKEDIGFASDINNVHIIERDGHSSETGPKPKYQIATDIFNLIAGRFSNVR